MTGNDCDAQAAVAEDWYRARLAVSEAIVAHRDLPALFLDLAGRLHQVVRFAYLALILHEATQNTIRLHALERAGPALLSSVVNDPVSESPGGLVWQTQRSIVISTVAERRRWPALSERAQRSGVQWCSRRRKQ